MAYNRDVPFGCITSSLIHGWPQLQGFNALNLEMDARDVGHDIRAVTPSGKLLPTSRSEPVIAKERSKFSFTGGSFVFGMNAHRP